MTDPIKSETSTSTAAVTQSAPMDISTTTTAIDPPPYSAEPVPDFPIFVYELKKHENTEFSTGAFDLYNSKIPHLGQHCDILMNGKPLRTALALV